MGIAGGWYFLAGIPAALLLGYLAIVDFKKLFFLLFALLPLTVEVWLPNGVVTDLPTEPMQVLLMGIYFLYVLKNGQVMRSDFLKHPITLLLLLHLGWLFFTAITSENFIVSFKFFLAKVWYITTFYFLAGTLMREEKDVKTLVWIVLIPLSFTIVYVLVRFAGYGFNFADVNKVMAPFYRNKVAFACMVSIFVPFVWYTRGWYRKYSIKWWMLLGGFLLLMVAVQYSYTRAAYVTLAMAAGSYFIIRWRMMKVALSGAVLLALLFIFTLVSQNAYLDHKPRYEKTITHEDFDDLIGATIQGTDVSTMERVYRWVAAGHMIADKPVLGFGPGTFTRYYQSYAVTGFRTYVSENREGSGIHCYYLMTWVEQGFIGAILFILLVFAVLLKGEQVYHETKDPGRRRILLMAILTTVVIDGLLIMNDLVETDKIGSFFFLCMALIVNTDLKNRNNENENENENEKFGWI